MPDRRALQELRKVWREVFLSSFRKIADEIDRPYVEPYLSDETILRLEENDDRATIDTVKGEYREMLKRVTPLKEWVL